jgi:hypothetical protein
MRLKFTLYKKKINRVFEIIRSIHVMQNGALTRPTKLNLSFTNAPLP